MKKKTLIFHIGTSAGFFSEYLEMAAAYTYCKKNNIIFKLFSKDANFGINKGWTDFFDPFCDEVDDNFHSKYNLRFKYPSLTKLILRKIIKKKDIPRWCWKKLSIWYLNIFITEQYYKKKYQFNFYTHDLWSKIQNNKTSNKNFKTEMMSTILKTWNLNIKTKNEVNEIIKTLNLPEKYIATQIRAGDKSNEQLVFDLSDYLKKIISLNSEILDLFVLTDDYSIINRITKEFPQYKIYTLCEKNENGYNNEQFQKLSKDIKVSKLIKLIASVEILWSSELFVGAINANPSLFHYYRNHNNSHWLNI